MARSLKITYGTLIVGLTPSDPAFFLTDKYEHEEVRGPGGRFRCAFTVVISAATEAAFRAAEIAFVAAADKRDQALTIELGGATRHSYSPTANTGLLTRGRAWKPGSPVDSGTCAEWNVEITGRLPENVAARAGREQASVQVTLGPDERRVVTFAGVYTAKDASDAKTQFDAVIDAFTTTELTFLGGTFNALPKQFDYDDERKLCTFKVVFHEGSLGLRFSHIAVEPDASGRRFLTFEGEYAATGANTALQQYNAQVDTFINAYLASIGGTYNTLPREYVYDEQDNLLRFRHRFEEILHAESLASTDLSAVVLPRINVRRLTFGDRRASIFPDTSPWELVFIDYSAVVRFSVTSDLETLYLQTLRPYILSQFNGTVVVMREGRDFQKESNVIRAFFICRVLKSGIISSSVRTAKTTDEGAVLLPRWDGNRFSRAKYQGIADEVIVVTVETLHSLGTVVNVDRAVQAHVTDPRYTRIMRATVEDDGLEGVDGDPTVQMIARTDVFVFARAEDGESEEDAGDDRPTTTGFRDDPDSGGIEGIELRALQLGG